MPDLKTALEAAIQKSKQAVLHKTIEEWSEDDKPQTQENTMDQPHYQFKPTNNVSRATFDYVLNNPGQTFAQISNALEARGYKKSSFTSLLSQMRRSKMIYRDAHDCYTALTAQYTPIKNGKATTPVKNKPGPKPKAASAGIAALKVDTAPVISNDIEYILNTLPIKQARALYDELHKIFGRTQ